MIILIITNNKVIARIIVVWKLAWIFFALRLPSQLFSFGSSNASLNWKLNQRFNLMAINHKIKTYNFMAKRFFFCGWWKKFAFVYVHVCVSVCVCCGGGGHHTIKLVFIENIPNILKQQWMKLNWLNSASRFFFILIKRKEQTNKANLINA